MKIGLIGLGWWGQKLLKLFSDFPQVQITAAWSRSLVHTKEIDLGNTRFYTDLAKMINTERFDAVIVSNAPQAHIDAVRLCAPRGINLFVEKPMATTLADCKEMNSLCVHHGVKLMIAFKHRFCKAFSAVKALRPQLGTPLWATYSYPLWKVDDPGWKFSSDGTGGIIIENVIHALDALIYLMGDVSSVFALGNCCVFKKPPYTDSVVTTLRFANGAIAALGGGCTGDQRTSQEYLDVHYQNGIAQIWGMLDSPYHLKILMRDEQVI